MTEDRLLALASRIADGADLDWSVAERDSQDADERSAVRELRVIASIAGAHRRLHAESARGAGEKEPDSVASSKPTDSIPPDAAAEAAGRGLPMPARWGPLRLVASLGEGKTSVVYLANDPGTERRVALKLARRPRPESRSVPAAIHEARKLARIRHPNVVTVHGADVHDGRAGIWMEPVQGRTLAQLARDQGAFGFKEATLVGIDLCRALAAVHHAGLIHQDIKAQNVMREDGGRIVLMDFSSSRDLNAGPNDERAETGGTPAYMAPETMFDQPPTVRSDIYSLGVLLYHLVSRDYPVRGGSWEEIEAAHRRRECVSVRDVCPVLPEAFVRVIERALAYDPSERFDSPGAMERALVAVLGADDPERAAPRRFSSRWIRAAAAVVAALGLAWGLHEILPPSEYAVTATLNRGIENRTPLPPGAAVSMGDALSLDFEASAPLFVYVINEDDLGNASLLFPLPGLMPSNPLAARRRHRLPGMRGDQPLFWQVDSAGGRERFLIVASPERLADFEAAMSGLTRPEVDQAPLDDKATLRLRGVASLVAGARTPTSSGRLSEMARQLEQTTSPTTRGVWVRQIELMNPRGGAESPTPVAEREGATNR